MGIETGIDLDALVDARAFISARWAGRPLCARGAGGGLSTDAAETSLSWRAAACATRQKRQNPAGQGFRAKSDPLECREGAR